MNLIRAVLVWVWTFPKRHPATTALLLVCGVFIFGLALQAREAEARREDLCESFNRQQAVIAELVKVATSGERADLSQLTSLPQFQALDPEDQVFWTIVLNASTGQGSGESSQDRLIAFARDKLKPADCSSA